MKEYIGLPVFSEKKMYEGVPPPGIMIGLAYNSYGGNILYIETIKSNFESGVQSEGELSSRRKGMIKLTGSLGDVMQESVQIAYTYAKYFTFNILNNNFLEENDVLYFPLDPHSFSRRQQQERRPFCRHHHHRQFGQFGLGTGTPN